MFTRSAARAGYTIDAIAVNLDFLSDIHSLAEVPAAVDMLSQAAQPPADACR